MLKQQFKVSRARFNSPISGFRNRVQSVRRAIDPSTGNRIQRRTTQEVYQGLSDNAWLSY
jgi:hypothetical protein